MRMSEIYKGEALFIDDERFPPSNGYDWIIVRSYDEAVNYASKYGIPSHISFDHDLGEGKSGYDFTKWMVEQDLDKGGTFIPSDFTYAVHSQNPIGTANIKAYLDAYIGNKNV